MRFRNAVYIAGENFSTVFKHLLYRLFIAAIIGSLAYVILKLGLAAITESAEVASLKELLGTFVHALLTGESEILQAFPGEFQSALAALMKLIAFNSASIIGCVIGLCLLYLLSRFMNGLALFAVGNVIGDRMSTYSHTSFSQAYFKSISKASLYQLIYVPICFVYDALALLICWFFFFYAPSFLPSWGFVTVLIAVSLTLTAIVCFESLKMTLISSWMPAVVADGKPVAAAFRASVRERKGFGARFAGFVAAIYLVIGVNVLFAVATVGSALLITVPLSYIFLLCLQFVNYFTAHGKKYFISRNAIEDPSDIQPK